jgi:hypothetical protein
MIVGALAISVDVLPMMYAMAMHKSKTSISSSFGQHREARPSACTKFVKMFKLILLPLFLFFESKKKLTHFLLCAYMLRYRALYCICPVTCDARECLKTFLCSLQKKWTKSLKTNLNVQLI